jgi:hypothetical protein
MAHSGHPWLHRTCPLSGVKRTWPIAVHMSAYDPKRTSVGLTQAPRVAVATAGRRVFSVNCLGSVTEKIGARQAALLAFKNVPRLRYLVQIRFD